MPRPTRWLWIAAIAVLSLCLVGALVASMFVPARDEYAPPPEGWVKHLVPADGTLLHTEMVEGHEIIIFREPESVISIAVVHPPHPRLEHRLFGGSIRTTRREPGVVDGPSLPNPPLPEHVVLTRHAVKPDFVGEFELSQDEQLTFRDGSNDTWSGSWVVPWTVAVTEATEQ